jgi:hypothetical protein
MGQQSKAIQARLKNLQKHVTTPQKAYVEDISDEEDADYNHTKQHGTADLLEEGFFFLDEDSDSDEDSLYGEEDIDEEELAELKTFTVSMPFLQRHRQLQSKLQRRQLSQSPNRKGITQEI